MGFLNRLFGSFSEDEPQPDISFGRYSDSYKKPGNQEAWNLALEKFETEEYLDSYRHFFRYLRDDQEDNVNYWDEEDGIRFEFYQGSKKITGFADSTKLKVEARVAQTNALNVGFMRRLIEKNFSLEYSRFAMDPEHNITIVFDTYTLDGSPYKLYYALKEVAINADKQDDLLLDEFRMLQPVDTSHLTEIPSEEKEAKYRFIVSKVQETLDEIRHGKLEQNKYPVGIAYLLLDTIYKLDYLIKPEGYMMETLERIHRVYFSNDGKSTAKKNQKLIRELEKLISRPKQEFFKEMYRVKSTFGITTPVNHDRIVSFIDGELKNMDWYQENGHDAVALSIPGYIVGYSMFNYAVPKPDRDLFHLYFQIVEPSYFKDLGFTVDFCDPDANQLNRRSVKRAVDRIVDKNIDRFPKLYPATSTLRFDSLPDFTRSYLLMMREMDLTKEE